MRHFFGHNYVYGLVPLFELNAEQNAPTLFSTCLFLAGALLFLAVGHASRVAGEHWMIWLLLSGIFVFPALDEFAALHERRIVRVRSALDVSGPLYYAWVVPYALAVVL